MPLDIPPAVVVTQVRAECFVEGVERCRGHVEGAYPGGGPFTVDFECENKAQLLDIFTRLAAAAQLPDGA
jgi:hypothetical protein